MTDDRCPQCDGLGKLLGRLGPVVHLRCQDCGWDFDTTSQDDETLDDILDSDEFAALTSPCDICGEPYDDHLPTCLELRPISTESYNYQ